MYFYRFGQTSIEWNMKYASAVNVFLIFLCSIKVIGVGGVSCQDGTSCYLEWKGCYEIQDGESLEDTYGFELLSSSAENSSDIWKRSILDFACECEKEAVNYQMNVIVLKFRAFKPVCYGREAHFTNVSDSRSEEGCFRQNQTLECDKPQSLCIGQTKVASIYVLTGIRPDPGNVFSCHSAVKERPKSISTGKKSNNSPPNPKTSYFKQMSLESLQAIYASLLGSLKIDDLLNLVKEAVAILKRPEIYQDFQVYQELQSGFMKILSHIIDDPLKEKWKKSQKIQNLVVIVEDVARALLMSLEYANRTNGDFSYSTPNVDIVANFSIQEKCTVHFTDAIISVAAKISARTALGTSAILYKRINDIFTSSRERSQFTYQQPMRVGSPVISIVARQDGKAVDDINGTVRYKIDESEDISRLSMHSVCVYWSENSNLSLGGAWSTGGVSLIEIYHQNNTNETHYTCSTNHLTNFAILMETSDFKVSKKDQAALEIITYVGCVLSLLCLLLTIFTLPWIRLKEIRFKIHFHLCVALAAGQIVFLSGINAVEKKIACTIVAIMLHYFYTVAFSWMLIEGIHLYQKIVVAYEKNRIKSKYYYIMAWGIPALIVGVSAAVRLKGYGTRKGCWLSLEEGFRWAFIGPALFVLMVNIIILTRVLSVIVNLRSDPLEKQKYAEVRAALKGVIILLPLLGLTWLFGLMSVNSETVVFQYLFATLNSLQGVFIFVLNYALNKEVRASFRRTLHRTTTTSL